jgi:cysteine desulfurase family protein (TIGR01976 family)
MAQPLDPHAVRPLFPALARDAAFLDGPGGSQAPGVVIEAMADHLRHGTANDGGLFATSLATIELIAEARRSAAELTGSAPEEIAFGWNMTTLNFQLAHAAARTFEAGDEIVVTDLDHDANVSPWLRVAEDRGLVVRHAPLNHADSTLDVDALAGLLSERTRVVAFTLASNAVGSITDARRISDLAHHAGALAWADAVHYAPHRRPDRGALGVDVLLCSPYKFFGPHLGIAAIRRDLAETWPADRVRPASEDPPGHRFETGTPSFEALAGTVAAEVLDTAYARIRAHEEALTSAVLDRLPAIEGVTLYGIPEPARVDERTPTFCFTVEGSTPDAVAEALAAEGVYVWSGNYYALSLMQSLGLEEHGGAVRAGFLHYNTADEVDRLIAAVEQVAALEPGRAETPRRDEAPA